MLLLGGFTLAAALSKCKLDKRLATFILSKAGTVPRTVLVANMFVAAFASMLISNVAAPVLCFSIIEVGSPHPCRVPVVCVGEVANLSSQCFAPCHRTRTCRKQ